MNKKTYDVIDGLVEETIKKVKESDAKLLKKVIRDIRDEGIHVSFICGSGNIFGFLKVIARNNTEFMKNKCRYKISVSPNFEKRYEDGKEVTGIKFICTGLICNTDFNK